MSHEQAASLARDFLAREVSNPRMPMALIEEDSVQIGNTIYFDCQSVAYLRSLNPADMAIGIGCIAVDAENGECRLVGAVEAAKLNLF